MRTNQFGKVLSLLLCGLLVFLAVCPVAADAWIPPDDDFNMSLMESPHEENACRALNVFASNYVEVNVIDYESMDTEQIARATLKHFELNPAVYPDDVSSLQIDGKTYMTISGSAFERRVKALYGMTVPAEDCPGYQEDGTIVVSAENYDATITVCASVRWVDYLGEGRYIASFDVVEKKDGVSGMYNITNNDLPASCKTIGQGSVEFFYFDTKAKSFSPSDFELYRFSMSVEGTIPFTNANEPTPNHAVAVNQMQGTEQARVETETETTKISVTEKSDVNNPAQNLQRQREAIKRRC